MAPSAERKSSPAALEAAIPGPSREVIDREVIDVAASLRRMGNNRELFCEVVAIYDEDSPQLLDRIRASVREGDAARLHRAAHSLKGLVSNFGASAAAEAAYALENMGTRRDLNGSHAALAALERELDRLNAALEPFMPGRTPR